MVDNIRRVRTYHECSYARVSTQNKEMLLFAVSVDFHTK